jgi:hypothetical protein
MAPPCGAGAGESATDPGVPEQGLGSVWPARWVRALLRLPGLEFGV